MARLACRLVSQGQSWEQAYPVLRKVADRTAETYPWSDGNLQKKYDSAREKGYSDMAELGRAGAGWVPGAAASTPQQGETVDPEQAAQRAREARQLAAQARRELHEHNQGWLHDADVNQLDFTLCVAVTGGSTENDEKLWGIIVGGSSSAKSEDIKMVAGTADARLSDLTAAGLISWMGTGKNMKPTGLLPRLRSPAFVVIEDMAPLLSDTADKRNRSKLIALLRKVYDGEVQRDLGGTPGPLDWYGKVTMLAASTKVIDQLSVVKWFGPTRRVNCGPGCAGCRFSCRVWRSGWRSCLCGAGRTGCRSRGCGR
jgi:hypothetical protein